MKLKITMLKAPWPEGAGVGDVVELPRMPGWAIGKCLEVADDTEVTAAFPEKDDGADHPQLAEVRQAAEQALTHAAAERKQMVDAHAAEVRNLKADHAAAMADVDARVADAAAGAGAKLQVLMDANAALTKQLADAQTALAAATKTHTGRR